MARWILRLLMAFTLLIIVFMGRETMIVPDGDESILIQDDRVSQIKITNVGTDWVSSIQLIIDNRYILGTLSVEEFLKYRVFGGKNPRDEITSIWTYLNENYAHYCSMGSPVESVRNNATLLQKIFSYSFECCSDVNPILEQLLLSRGYEVRTLFSALHQALEVKTIFGWRYIDSDHEKYFHYSLKELQAGIEQDENYDGENYYGWLFNSANTNGESPYEEVILDPNFLEGLTLDLAPGESIEFVDEFNLDRVVAIPAISKTSMPEAWEEDVDFVTVYSNYRPIYHSTLDPDESDGCSTFSVSSNYIINQAYLSLPDDWPPNARFYLKSIDESDEWILVPHESLSGSNKIALDRSLFSLGHKAYILTAENIGTYWGGYSYSFWPTDFVLTQGLAYRFALPQEYALFEDDTELGPANSYINTVTSLGGSDFKFMGGGAYSFQHGELIFSTFDGSDPRTNGHTYTFEADTYSLFWDPFGEYSLDFQVCGLEDSYLNNMEVTLTSQFNRNNFPTAIDSLVVSSADSNSLRVEIQ